MKRRALVLCAAMSVFVPMLAGCWNMRELEHMFYAHAIGIDYDNGKFKLFVQILDLTTLGKQEGGGTKSGQGSWVGKGEGSTLQAAIHDLYATTQRRIYWGHVNTAVVGENALKHGVHQLLDQLTRYNEFRYTIWVFGTQYAVEDILLASPILESTPVYSQLGDPKDVFNQSSFIRPTRLYDFVANLREPGTTEILPMIGLSEGHWKDNRSDYTALKVTGAGIMNAGNWTGYISKEKLVGCRWLDDGAVRIPLAIEQDGRIFASAIFSYPDTNIKPITRGGNVSFDIKIKVNGDIVEMSRDASESDLKRMAEEHIREEVRLTYREGLRLHADPLNLLASLYRKKLRAWKQWTAANPLPLNEGSLANVHVEVSITNRGRTNEPFPGDRKE